MTAELRWGVKESLLRYVANTHGGKVELDGVEHADGQFHFPLTEFEGTPGEGAGFAKFTGSVRVYGPFGMPIQELTDPSISWDDTDASLSIVRWPGRPDRLRGWIIRPLVAWEDEYRAGLVQLSPEGAELFGGQYPPSTEFDRLSFTLA